MSTPDKDALAAIEKAEAIGASDAVELLPVKPLPPLAEKATDLDALRTVVVDAAAVGGTLWITYLAALFYLLIAVGAVTHQNLFLESPVKLPFLNVDLPLLGFFWLGPCIFIILHAYVLLHFVMLTKKISAFDRELKAQIGIDTMRADLRGQLPSNIFVQFLAGPRELRYGIVGTLLWLIALISLAIGPVLLLMFFELQFLPYHNQWITWIQRLAVGADLVLLWCLWPSIALLDALPVGTEAASIDPMPRSQRWTRTILYGLTIVSALLMLTIGTFPGEYLDTWLRPSEGQPAWKPLAWLRTPLVEGEPNAVTRRPDSLWSNRLVLSGFDVVDHTKLDTDDKIAAQPVTVSLRGRDLRGAVLIGAGLRKVDLLGADLTNAKLDYADLRGANTNRPHLRLIGLGIGPEL